jgi:hypothetical protein
VSQNENTCRGQTLRVSTWFDYDIGHSFLLTFDAKRLWASDGSYRNCFAPRDSTIREKSVGYFDKPSFLDDHYGRRYNFARSDFGEMKHLFLLCSELSLLWW